jgi:hypothetical protein
MLITSVFHSVPRVPHVKMERFAGCPLLSPPLFIGVRTPGVRRETFGHRAIQLISPR